MPIVSLRAAGFLLPALIAYFAVPKRLRWTVLLGASMYFYASFGIKYSVYIIFTSIVTFFAALTLERINSRAKEDAAKDGLGADGKKRIRLEAKRRKKSVCFISCVLTFGIWIALKYGNFAFSSLERLLCAAGADVNLPRINLLLPVGISFYTFTAAGYLFDIYRSKYKAEKNFFRCLLFISFFGHIVQGPFSRYDRLSPTLFAGNSFDYERMTAGLRRMLWGVFKKTVTADPMGAAVKTVVSVSGEGYPGWAVLLSAVLYGIRIYADFSGYMDIVAGACEIMGVELEENFRRPYFARSVEEFWQRWHITLGTWFRDYMFYPISMSPAAQKLGRTMRKKFGPKAGKLVPGYVALIFVWTSTGLWHGASFKFVIWGWLNLFAIMCGLQFEESFGKLRTALGIDKEKAWYKAFSMAKTFLLVSLFRLFSAAGRTLSALLMYKRLFFSFAGALPEGGFIALFGGLEVKNIAAAFVGALMLLAVDILEERGKWESVKSRCPALVKHILAVFMIIAILLFAGKGQDLAGNFMYANF